MISVDELLAKLPLVPYERFGRDLSGMDCFGLVEYWHEHVLGIRIRDRYTQESTPAGFFQGFKDRRDWVEVEAPEDHVGAVMTGMINGTIYKFGHCGMCYKGRVYQFSDGIGFNHAPVTARNLRINAFMRHRECTATF